MTDRLEDLPSHWEWGTREAAVLREALLPNLDQRIASALAGLRRARDIADAIREGDTRDNQEEA